MVRIASVAVVALAALAVIVVNPLSAQKTGEAVPASFKDLPGVDGKKHSASEYKKDILVICITCNHCPVAIAYEARMIKFATANKDKVDFVAINVNNGEADKLPKMIERAKSEGFTFPYLYDETQQIARDLKATKTPHFFMFNKERKLVYFGAMDDSQNSPKTSYLDAAVKATLAGQTPEKSSTKAVGCGIQYDNKK